MQEHRNGFGGAPGAVDADRPLVELLGSDGLNTTELETEPEASWKY